MIDGSHAHVLVDDSRLHLHPKSDKTGYENGYRNNACYRKDILTDAGVDRGVPRVCHLIDHDPVPGSDSRSCEQYGIADAHAAVGLGFKSLVLGAHEGIPSFDQVHRFLLNPRTGH